MCFEANRILQKLWKPQIGDFYCSLYWDINYENSEKSKVYLDTPLKIQIIVPPEILGKFISDGEESEKCQAYENLWLPRQDQLQDMLDKPTEMAKHLFFADWINDECHEYDCDKAHIVDSLTMEQLWLMFIMKENYNKIWKDNKWISQ